MDASRAYELGILNKVVEPEELENEAMALARKIAAQPPVAIRLLKMQVYRGLSMTLDQALELAADGEAMTLKTEDHKLALEAFFKKKEAKYLGR